MVEKFVFGKLYKFKRDYTDDTQVIGGFIPVGTIVRFNGPNLGYARFVLCKQLKTYGGSVVSLKPKVAFQILEERGG